MSEPGGAYAEAAAAVATEIGRVGPGQVEILVRPWSELPGGARQPSLVVAVGSRALAGFVERGGRVPILALLVPESTFRRLEGDGRNGGPPRSAVFLAQPPERQFSALRIALPERNRVGLLFGPESSRYAASYQVAAAENGLQLATGLVKTPEEVGSVLRSIIDDSDLLLAVADPAVFNNESVRNILTTAYRRRVPVAGFSPSYVRAGALLAIYSTPAQLGRQAGEMARAFLSGRPLPPPQSPRDFTLGINGEVARSLGLPLKAEDGEALAAQLRQAERKR